MDITVSRENNKFITSVYSKPTVSGVFTNFENFIPDMRKRGLNETLLRISLDYAPITRTSIGKLKF